MNRLPTAKRNQLFMVMAATAGAICLVYFFLILPQHNKIKQLAGDMNAKHTQLQKIKDTIKQEDATAAKLADLNKQLDQAEADVATGDVYAWTYDTLRRFKANYHVDIPNIGQPTPGDVDLLSGFPYRQVKTSLVGTGYYHDLGKFICDFENNFPHMRLVNLSMEPAGSAEKLNFRMEVITLVKPNS